MGKETSYQRLKRELAETKDKLAEVCLHPESQKSKNIIFTIKFLHEQGKMLSYGGPNGFSGLMDGLLKQVNKNCPFQHFE